MGGGAVCLCETRNTPQPALVVVYERCQRLDHQALQLAHLHRLGDLELGEELHEALGGKWLVLRLRSGCAR